MLRIPLLAAALAIVCLPASAATTFRYIGNPFTGPFGEHSSVSGTITFAVDNPVSTTLFEEDIADFDLTSHRFRFGFSGSSFLDAEFTFDSAGQITAYGFTTEQELFALAGVEQLTLENGSSRFFASFDELILGDISPSSIRSASEEQFIARGSQGRFVSAPAPVSLPAGGMLLLSGLIGLALRRRSTRTA